MVLLQLYQGGSQDRQMHAAVPHASCVRCLSPTPPRAHAAVRYAPLCNGRISPTHDEIAQLAFSLYESRGRQDGHHIEDWLRAEQELVLALRVTAKYRTKHTKH
jgi:hypothetical protein